MKNRSSISGVRNQEPSAIFKINALQLQDLFSKHNSLGNRLNTLNDARYGGVQGVLKNLQSEEDSGIMGDQADLRRRKTKYSKNEKPRSQQPPFFESVKDALNDRILLLVGILAVLSIIPGMIVSPKNGWVEGVFILVALLIQVMITAWNDNNKDSKFVKLQELNREEHLPVLRGKRGSMQTISVWDLVVGDIIQLKPGDKIPADCLVVYSANLRVDEIKREDGEEGEPTVVSFQNMAKDENDPFLYADSYVSSGVCKAVICAVGEYSSRGTDDITYNTADQETELTQKLDNIGGSIKFMAIIAAIVILATSLIVLFIDKAADENLENDVFVKNIVDAITIAFIILIVSIPEGLPMTVAVSLANSVLQMSDYDNILVRDLQSVEQVGLIDDLCLGKTGTMTTEEMEVVNLYTQDLAVLNSRKNTFLNCKLDSTIISKITESILFNSQAYIEMTENSFYVPVGQGTEVSLIKWLQAAEIPVHEIIAQKEGNILAQVPFNSTLKRSIIAVRHTQLEDTVRIYIKGAPETVIQNCQEFYTSDPMQNQNDEGYLYCPAQKVPFDQDMKNSILQNQFREMTEQGLRTIAFSYRDMSENEFNGLLARMNGEIDSPEEIRQLEEGQTFLALISLRDPPRNNVKEVVQTAKDNGITLRLISGDNLMTATACARDVGIITQAEYLSIKQGEPGFAMDASRFREITGDVRDESNSDVELGSGAEAKKVLSPENQRQFNEIIGDLKVIGRADPEDKLRLVAGLRGMLDENYLNEDEEDENLPRRKVAVIGEGINDVNAFKAADVSFAVQDGTSMARNNASMILRTNDFDSAMKAVMWGRNIYVNVQRFLQFQLTCNFSVLVVVLVSTITMQESCLNAVQLIYINLIMDVLGALALASTRPQASTSCKRTAEGNLMTPFMYRQIMGVTLYMLGIMMIIMYAGKSIFNLSYEGAVSPLTDEGKPKLIHLTLIWNTFIFLQVFNLINCRNVDAESSNGFKGLMSNFLTWIILLIIIAVQTVSCFTFIGNPLFQVGNVSGREFAVTVTCAASVLIANTIFKFIPERWVAKMPTLNESKSLGSNTRLMAAYDKQASAGFMKKKGGDATADQPLPEEEHYSGDQDDFRPVQ